jgi:hypothetical protein
MSENAAHEVIWPDGSLFSDADGVSGFPRERASLIAGSIGGKVVRHVNYPHEAGRLFDCPACESACHCGPGVARGEETECVYHAEDNPRHQR